MAEVAQGAQQEFWRPPSHRMGDDEVLENSISAMAEACPRCGTEFLLGSRFCHSCGGRRPDAISSAARADAAAIAGMWERGIARLHSAVSGFSLRKVKVPSWLGYLHFHEIKSRLGLSRCYFIGFV